MHRQNSIDSLTLPAYRSSSLISKATIALTSAVLTGALLGGLLELFEMQSEYAGSTQTTQR